MNNVLVMRAIKVKNENELENQSLKFQIGKSSLK